LVVNLIPAVSVAERASAVHAAGAVDAPLFVLARHPLVDISAAAAGGAAAVVAEDAAFFAFRGNIGVLRYAGRVGVYGESGIFIDIEFGFGGVRIDDVNAQIAFSPPEFDLRFPKGAVSGQGASASRLQ